jgi:broad specificity phosphatase PhoE
MIRHGETEDNVSKVFSRDDTKLSEIGKEQIKRTRELLKDFKFDKVYYSPLERTKETLGILGLEGIPNTRIREINFGIFAGLNYNEILEKYPQETKSWENDPLRYIIPEGESLNVVYNRVWMFLEEIIKHNENIIIVAHEGVIRLALCWIFNDPNFFYRFKIDHGSINVISVEDGFKYIKKLNYI